MRFTEKARLFKSSAPQLFTLGIPGLEVWSTSQLVIGDSNTPKFWMDNMLGFLWLSYGLFP